MSDYKDSFEACSPSESGGSRGSGVESLHSIHGSEGRQQSEAVSDFPDDDQSQSQVAFGSDFAFPASSQRSGLASGQDELDLEIGSGLDVGTTLLPEPLVGIAANGSEASHGSQLEADYASSPPSEAGTVASETVSESMKDKLGGDGEEHRKSTSLTAGLASISQPAHLDSSLCRSLRRSQYSALLPGSTNDVFDGSDYGGMGHSKAASVHASRTAVNSEKSVGEFDTYSGYEMSFSNNEELQRSQFQEAHVEGIIADADGFRTSNPSVSASVKEPGAPGNHPGPIAEVAAPTADGHGGGDAASETEEVVDKQRKAQSTPSSNFSTLSQHLQRGAVASGVPVSMPLQTSTKPAEQAKSDVAAATAAPPLADKTPQPAAVISPSPNAGVAAVTTPESAPLEGAGPAPVLEFRLPPPPRPAAAMEAARSALNAPIGGVPLPGAAVTSSLAPPPSFSTRPSAGAATAPASESPVPPPLPLPAGSAPPASFNAINPKVVELQETSAAVEKLVRAFAFLRGHFVTDQPQQQQVVAAELWPSQSHATAPQRLSAAQFGHHLTDTMASQRMHNVIGDAATYATVPLSKQLKLRSEEAAVRLATRRKDQSDKQVAIEANEVLLEGAILTLVMEMLEREKPKPEKAGVPLTHLSKRSSRSGGSALHRLRTPAEVVSAAQFKFGESRDAGRSFQEHPPGTSKSRGWVPSLGDTADAFGTGSAGASDALFKAISDALEKYVIAHISETAKHSVRNPYPVVSSGFARAVLLDLLSVCLQIAELCFTESDVGCVRPGEVVIVQYDGPKSTLYFATNAIHCLPFEELKAPPASTAALASSDPIPKAKFRMEYWVTKDKMWVVIAALQHTLREEEYARSNDYRDLLGFPSFNSLSSGVQGSSSVPSNSVPDPPAVGRVEEVLSSFPRASLFSLVDRIHSPNTVAASGDSSSSRYLWGRPSNGERENTLTSNTFFDLPRAPLEAVAFAVSKMSADLLNESATAQEAESIARLTAVSERGRTALVSQPSTQVMPTAPPNAARRVLDTTVCEAVNELLGDMAVRNAIRRRVEAKLREKAKALSTIDLTQLPEKVERDRQFLALERAERQVEHVVERIRKEMQSQKCSTLDPL